MHIQPSTLSTLYQGCVFRSDEKVASHLQVARELAEHDLHWRRGAVGAALFKARVNRLQLMALRYGAEVEVRPRPFDGFALVHTSLEGCTEFECDGGRVTVPQGRTAIIAPKKHIRMLWSEGSEQLILKIPHALLRDVAGEATRGAPGAGPADALAPCLLLPPALGQHWTLMLQSLLGILALPAQAAGQTAWIDHYERNVALFLMAQQWPSRAAPGPGPEPQAAPGAGAGPRLDALERYMRAKLCAPVTLPDLARAAGVSERSLNLLCRRHYGASPMDVLRNMRLDAAHARLSAHPGAGVAETALEFGFGHPGRFATYFRERFGHSPRLTQQALN